MHKINHHHQLVWLYNNLLANNPNVLIRCTRSKLKTNYLCQGDNVLVVLVCVCVCLLANLQEKLSTDFDKIFTKTYTYKAQTQPKVKTIIFFLYHDLDLKLF